jgi:hypothetical protein
MVQYSEAFELYSGELVLGAHLPDYLPSVAPLIAWPHPVVVQRVVPSQCLLWRKVGLKLSFRAAWWQSKVSNIYREK